jgi:hypothetical protein
MAAATVGAIGLEPLLGSKHSAASAAEADGRLRGSERAEEAEEIRIAAARAERRIPTPPHTASAMPTSAAPTLRHFCKKAPGA